MPRYHFPSVDGTKLVDPVGLELQNDEQAKRQAELIAKHVRADRRKTSPRRRGRRGRHRTSQRAGEAGKPHSMTPVASPN
ncbi:DUF6894 family protein [Tardiphaga robiniae]|uniref:DUF6894 family protein n=1 Tax=Tardiphaga TaxID=1395974 RepID=UPI0035B56CD9